MLLPSHWLTLLICLWLEELVPRAWKRARVVPIFKSGDISSLNNYRPISILPIVSKIVERTVHKQLSEFLDINNI